MEPTPPPGSRPKFRGRGRRYSKDVEFYEVPPDVKTSAQIVSEAKRELEAKVNLRDKVRGVATTRPYTPREDNRTLFGATSNDSLERAASSLSINSQFLEGLGASRPSSAIGSRPLSGLRPLSGSSTSAIPDSPTRSVVLGSSASSSRRLAPLERGATLIDDGKPPRPNSGENKRRAKSRLLHNSTPANTPNGSDGETPRSGSLTDLKLSDDKGLKDRRVHSGPKERTNSHIVTLEERGEGDGQEVSSPTKRLSSSADKQGRGNTEFIESTLQPLIDTLRRPSLDSSIVVDTCNEIYEVLDSSHLLGKACSKRTSILKAVFKCMEKSGPPVLLSLSRLALALRVSDKYLTLACKVIFKVSRDRRNDDLFMNNNIIDLMLDTVISLDCELQEDAVLYCCGVIKFLAANPTLAKAMTKKCTIYTLSSILTRINKKIDESEKPKDVYSRVLHLVTGAFRSFAEIEACVGQFTSHGIVDELCVTAVLLPNEVDTMVNVCSTFSKLTEHKVCCEALGKHPQCYRSLLKVLSYHKFVERLALRVCFVLGNLAQHSDESRIALFRTKDSLSVLVDTFEFYMGLVMKGIADAKADKVKVESGVLTKVIRVIANLSMNEQVGLNLCDNRKCIDLLIQIINIEDMAGLEEVVLNSMSTINNVCFYSISGTVMEEYEVDICRGLMKMLLRDHTDPLVAEVCRIFGNLTRNKLVREFLTANSVMEIVVTLLDSGDPDLVYFCAGVLTNLMHDADKRPVLKRENGIAKLIDVLKDFATTDWQLAGLVCQVLWNYSIDIRSSNLTFGERESQELVNLLTDYIDNAHLPSESSSTVEIRQYLHDTWISEFCAVAAQLRKRVKSHQSKFVELSPPRS